MMMSAAKLQTAVMGATGYSGFELALACCGIPSWMSRSSCAARAKKAASRWRKFTRTSRATAPTL